MTEFHCRIDITCAHDGRPSNQPPAIVTSILHALPPNDPPGVRRYGFDPWREAERGQAVPAKQTVFEVAKEIGSPRDRASVGMRTPVKWRLWCPACRLTYPTAAARLYPALEQACASGMSVIPLPLLIAEIEREG